MPPRDFHDAGPAFADLILRAQRDNERGAQPTPFIAEWARTYDTSHHNPDKHDGFVAHGAGSSPERDATSSSVGSNQLREACKEGAFELPAWLRFARYFPVRSGKPWHALVDGAPLHFLQGDGRLGAPYRPDRVPGKICGLCREILKARGVVL